MRITPTQVRLVKNAVSRYLGDRSRVWVFGSRVDDRRRGGDYDFYIETLLKKPEKIVSGKLELLAYLHGTRDFEGEKIDIVIRAAVPGPDLPIYKVAKEDGIPL